VESVLQPFAEGVALDWTADDAAQSNPSAPSAFSVASVSSVDRCPLCGHQPIVASLREHGHGSRRSLVCGLCLREFRAHRITCLSCGQGDFNALPVYRADDLPGVRVDACEACRTYIKTVDLTQSARAIPVVDDLASLPLDLWAREQGYRKLRPNLLRL
jgi:FdhE protein